MSGVPEGAALVLVLVRDEVGLSAPAYGGAPGKAAPATFPGRVAPD
ncbi:MAG: hypothetical protein ACJ77E_07170 [Gaiellaceae bacterium]